MGREAGGFPRQWWDQVGDTQEALCGELGGSQECSLSVKWALVLVIVPPTSPVLGTQCVK